MKSKKLSYKEKKYSVYVHINLINGYTYVGVTSLNPNYRFGKNGSYYKKNPKFKSDIATFGWDNFDHLVLKEDLSYEDATDMEVSLISIYRIFGRCYNLDSGGFEHTTKSPETIKRMSLAKSGSKSPMWGKRGKLNSLSKPVNQIDPKTHKVIKVWESMNLAETELGIARSAISNVCRGKSQSAGNFEWTFKN